MITMDVPYVPMQDAPIVLAQAATPGAGAAPDYILKVCHESASAGGSNLGFNTISPAGMLKNYLRAQDKTGAFKVDRPPFKVTMLEGATHGRLNAKVSSSGTVYYLYEPVAEYTGNDKAIFMIEFEGKRYKIVVNLVVAPNVGESPLLEGESPVCSPPQLIKVNGKPVSGSSGYNMNLFSVSKQPNPSFERDAAKARRPSTLRYANDAHLTLI